MVFKGVPNIQIRTAFIFTFQENTISMISMESSANYSWEQILFSPFQKEPGVQKS